MTANLERLIVVAKEKERLESELAIAREVQKQLFPKDIPFMRTAQILGVCNPARMVSGDYYDFMSLPDSTLAFAIGDVAGKGISAALLMAAIQSTMRTQLTAAAPMAARRATDARTILLHRAPGVACSTSSSTPTPRPKSTPPSTSGFTTRTAAS